MRKTRPTVCRCDLTHLFSRCFFTSTLCVGLLGVEAEAMSWDQDLLFMELMWCGGEWRGQREQTVEHLSIYLSIHLSFCSLIFPPTHHTHLSIHSSIYSPIHPKIHLFIHSSIYSSVHPSIHPFVHPPYPSISSPVHPFILLFIHSSLHPFTHHSSTHPFINHSSIHLSFFYHPPPAHHSLTILSYNHSSLPQQFIYPSIYLTNLPTHIYPHIHPIYLYLAINHLFI